MAMLVAAAGAGLGAWAGGRLKDMAGENIPDDPIKLDTVAPLSFLQQSSDSGSYYNSLGLGLYENSLKSARDEIGKGFASAAAELRPSSQASKSAMNEMMRFMGLDPIQSTVGFNDRLGGLGLAGDTSKISSLIEKATN